MESGRSIRWSYLLLLVVMAGRTALFVSRFDSLIVLPWLGNVTLLSVLMAVAFIGAVSGGSYIWGISNKGERRRKKAIAAVIIGSLLDGTFNLAEAAYLAIESGTFSGIEPPVLWFFWTATVLIGVGPTGLTIVLASLAGELDRRSDRSAWWQVAVQRVIGGGQSSTQAGVRAGRQANAALPGVQSSGSLPNAVVQSFTELVNDDGQKAEHLRSLVVHLGGRTFSRADAESVLGLAKVQTLNVLNYGIERGFIVRSARGVYEVAAPVQPVNDEDQVV